MKLQRVNYVQNIFFILLNANCIYRKHARVHAQTHKQIDPCINNTIQN